MDSAGEGSSGELWASLDDSSGLPTLGVQANSERVNAVMIKSNINDLKIDLFI